tara:strand:+ start:153 stop:596 length:444 start_codon:yes stop_codon:yes gene_type:complete
MKQLYEDTDNTPLMKDYLFPYLNEQTCDYQMRGELEALRCVCKKLNKIISPRVSANCEKYRGKCIYHCKAYPFYKHLDNRYRDHMICNDQFIHFRKKCIADMFLTRYRVKIERCRRGKPRTCCGGKGFVMIMTKEKRQRMSAVEQFY